MARAGTVCCQAGSGCPSALPAHLRLFLRSFAVRAGHRHFLKPHGAWFRGPCLARHGHAALRHACLPSSRAWCSSACPCRASARRHAMEPKVPMLLPMHSPHPQRVASASAPIMSRSAFSRSSSRWCCARVFISNLQAGGRGRVASVHRRGHAGSFSICFLKQRYPMCTNHCWFHRI